MASAEPGRKSGYSRDIVWRVVWQKVGMGLTFREIAERLQIAVGTAHRIFRKFQETGDIAQPKHKRQGIQKLDHLQETYILCIVSERAKRASSVTVHASLKL